MKKPKPKPLLLFGKVMKETRIDLGATAWELKLGNVQAFVVLYTKKHDESDYVARVLLDSRFLWQSEDRYAKPHEAARALRTFLTKLSKNLEQFINAPPPFEDCECHE